MPSVWEWELPDGASIDRRDMHRRLSRWLDDDHHVAAKARSWSLQPSGSAGRVVRLGLVDDTLAGRLLEHADAYRRSARPTGDLAMPTPLKQVEAVTWPQLAAGRDRPGWTLEFVSPVTFRRGNRFVPWPSPSAVFGSLRAAWRRFGARHVGDLEVDLRLDPIVVTAISGASQVERVVLHERPNPSGERQPVTVTVGGFLGRVTYAVDGTIDPAAVDSLTRLAPYTGVGSYTTRGFGGVRVSHPNAPG